MVGSARLNAGDPVTIVSIHTSSTSRLHFAKYARLRCVSRDACAPEPDILLYQSILGTRPLR